MSDMKPKGNAIKLGNRECRLLFTINVMDSFQDKFNLSISDIATTLQDFKLRFKVLRFLLAEMINEFIQYAQDVDPDSEDAKQPPVTERWVGTMLNAQNLGGLQSAILTAMAGDMPQGDDDDPNPESGQ